MVFLESVAEAKEVTYLRRLIEEHNTKTGSKIASIVLENWMSYLPKFVKVYPHDYKAAMERAEAATSAVEEVKAPKAEAPAEEPVLLDLEDSIPDEAMLKSADKVRGFAKYKRRTDKYRKADKRVEDFDEINSRLTEPELKIQAARCMDCGVPFCQSDATGCPIGNVIPKWNDLVFNNRWKEALNRLLLTNNFPEFTGRVCPAPCEGSCVLGINELPVAIKSIECAIIDKGFAEGWILPTPPTVRTGKKVAIIGSGPAGLAAADQLNKAGHSVTVYDRNDRFGGLLMYGIPNMKLDKKIVQRRIDLMAAEGVTFVANADVGTTVDAAELQKDNDALVLAVGATWPRDLKIPGRQLDGVHFAMEFLQSTTKSLLDSSLQDGQYMNVKDKHVVVIGGGDTGNDCIGTSVRLGAKSVVNFELLPQPPNTRAEDNPWPQYPRVFKLDYGHSEVKTAHGKDPREYQILSKEFLSDGNGRVKGIKTVKVEWTKSASGRWDMAEIEGSEQIYEADMVFLSMGFMGPETAIIEQLQVKKDARSNMQTAPNKYMTSVEGVFAAGDCRRGQSLIVWGINEGRMAARESMSSRITAYPKDQFASVLSVAKDTTLRDATGDLAAKPSAVGPQNHDAFSDLKLQINDLADQSLGKISDRKLSNADGDTTAASAQSSPFISDLDVDYHLNMPPAETFGVTPSLTPSLPRSFVAASDDGMEFKNVAWEKLLNNLFKSLPNNEPLFVDHNCAYQGEHILHQYSFSSFINRENAFANMEYLIARYRESHKPTTFGAAPVPKGGILRNNTSDKLDDLSKAIAATKLSSEETPDKRIVQSETYLQRDREDEVEVVVGSQSIAALAIMILAVALCLLLAIGSTVILWKIRSVIGRLEKIAVAL
ncbi:glutamate synthase [NADH] [Entophlyctis luteolus]|nr:glutamate synthase [NADH] [Entophlyctis luteolus]